MTFIIPPVLCKVTGTGDHCCSIHQTGIFYSIVFLLLFIIAEIPMVSAETAGWSSDSDASIEQQGQMVLQPGNSTVAAVM